nr:unnamed protein product [Callosobruchus analis]
MRRLSSVYLPNNDGDAELAIPCEGDGQSSEIEFEVTNDDIVIADLSEHVSIKIHLQYN